MIVHNFDVVRAAFTPAKADPPLVVDADVVLSFTPDLRVRLESASGRMDELLLERMAFEEGRLLSIHPFTDFNGRMASLFLRELLRRMALPPVDLAPADPSGEAAYRAALRAGDAMNWQPLMAIWQQRFERFDDSAA